MQVPPLLNEPPAPPSLHATVPVGAVFVPLLVSLTVAVKAIVLPVATEAGFGDTLVPVPCRLTVNDDVPELAVCEESPE